MQSTFWTPLRHLLFHLLANHDVFNSVEKPVLLRFASKFAIAVATAVLLPEQAKIRKKVQFREILWNQCFLKLFQHLPPCLRIEGQIPENIDISLFWYIFHFQPTMPRQSVQTQDNLGEAIICTIGCDNNRFFPIR